MSWKNNASDSELTETEQSSTVSRISFPSANNKRRFNLLVSPAKQDLAVPATSALVARVFFIGSFMMRPGGHIDHAGVDNFFPI